MKKIILVAAFVTGSLAASAQILPTFAFGIKGGVNFAKFKTESDLTDNSNRTGYLAGVWMRLAGAGIHLQPELYLTGKGNTFNSIQATGATITQSSKVTFTSLDLPVLVGTRFGIGPLGARINAGPVISFIVDKNTTFTTAYNSVADFGNYKNQTWAFQTGVGADIGKLAVDLRYEFGLSNVSRSEIYKQKQNLVNLSLGIKLF